MAGRLPRPTDRAIDRRRADYCTAGKRLNTVTPPIPMRIGAWMTLDSAVALYIHPFRPPRTLLV